jgi:Ca-activated chloride channel family protein
LFFKEETMRAQSRDLLRLLPALLLIVLTACGGATPTATTGGVAAPAPTAPTNNRSQMPAAQATAAPAPTAPLMVAPAAESTAAPAADLAQAPIAGEPLPPATPQRPVEVNPFMRTSDDHLSTFAMDVDTAAYTAARNYLNAGQLPPPEAVRVEEFVNYFHYDYPQPQQDAFGISVDAAPSPFGQPGAQLVRVGIQGRRIDDSQRADAVLTFVIDISGSMAEPNRLPLVKQALRLLVDQLHQNDQVAIVVYGDTAYTVLDHTSAANRQQILQAIDSLENSGSTNA